MKFSGDIKVFVESIGLKIPDTKIIDAVVIVASDFEISETNFGGENIEYWEFFKRGTCFKFNEKNILNAIFFFIKENNGYYKYPFLDDLIIGINDKSSGLDIENLLGIPNKVGKQWIKYKIDEQKYIHFEFDESSELKQITIGLID